MPKIQIQPSIDSEREFLAGWTESFPSEKTDADADAIASLPKLPGNVVEWFERPGYLFEPEIISSQRDPKTGCYLFPHAFAALRDFFDLLCPYCQDAEKIEKTPVDEQDFPSQVLLRYGRCPQCEISLVDVQRAKRARNALEFVLSLGMGSGKTAVIAGTASFITASAARLPSVRKAFGFAPGGNMEIAFVASTGQQAKKTIWAYYTSYLEGSPWWKRYRRAADSHEMDSGETLLEDGTSVWKFPKSGFESQSLHSNSGGLAGLRRLASFIDELARFDTEGRRGAHEVYQVLIGSMQNTWRAYDEMLTKGVIPPFKPFVGACSSPIHEGDKIMTLGAEAERNPNSRIFYKNMPTWEWNPHFKMEDFAREFAREPRRAERDYGAKPMGLNERVIPPGVVERCVDPTRPNLVRTGEQFYRDPRQVPMMKILLSACARDRSVPRFVHADAGYVRDSFGLICGHAERDTETGIVRVIIDAVIEARPWTPPGQPIRYEIDFDSVGELILELGKRWLLARGTFDQWQSISQIQRLRAAGHDFHRVELKEEDWENVRDLAESGRLILPATETDKYDRDDRHSPVRKVVYELTSMERKGTKIDHPADGSSDLAVGVCGVVKQALENSGMTIDMKGKGGRPVPPGWTSMASLSSVPRHRRIGSAVRLNRW